jgi:hypothetical protein
MSEESKDLRSGPYAPKRAAELREEFEQLANERDHFERVRKWQERKHTTALAPTNSPYVSESRVGRHLPIEHRSLGGEEVIMHEG